MRLDSCERASSSLLSASTLRATAAGEKSSMLSKVSSTFRLPSPVSVLGTANATRGFIAFMRLSKLSTSISRNLRSSTGGSGCAGFPDKWARTPMTKGRGNLFFPAVQRDVVLDLHARGAITRDELLTTCLGHEPPPAKTK